MDTIFQYILKQPQTYFIHMWFDKINVKYLSNDLNLFADASNFLKSQILVNII